MSYEERGIHVSYDGTLRQTPVCTPSEEEDTCMSCEEEDACIQGRHRFVHQGKADTGY